MNDKLKEIPKEIQFKNIRDRVYRLEPLNSSYPEFAVGTIQRVTCQLGRQEVIEEIEKWMNENKISDGVIGGLLHGYKLLEKLNQLK